MSWDKNPLMKGKKVGVPLYLLKKAMLLAEARFQSRFRPEKVFQDTVEVDGNRIFLAFELQQKGERDFLPIVHNTRFVKK